jgi:hypothetical protein
MRYYLIRNTEAEVRRKNPSNLQDGELVVTSRAELDAARLSARQLLGLLNTMTGRSATKLGDRKKAIGRLWTARRNSKSPQASRRRSAPLPLHGLPSKQPLSRCCVALKAQRSTQSSLQQDGSRIRCAERYRVR